MGPNQMTGRVKGVSFTMVDEGDKEVVQAKIVFESTATEGMADYITSLLKKECLITLQPVQLSFGAGITPATPEPPKEEKKPETKPGEKAPPKTKKK